VVEAQLQLVLQEKTAEECTALRELVSGTTESVVAAVHAELRSLGVEPRTPTAADLEEPKEEPAEPEPVVEAAPKEEKAKPLTAAEKQAAAEKERVNAAEEEKRRQKEEKKRREKEAAKAKEEARLAEKKAKEQEATSAEKAARDVASQAADAAKRAARDAKEQKKVQEKLDADAAKAAELLAVETRNAFVANREKLLDLAEAGAISFAVLPAEAIAALAQISAGVEFEEEEAVTRACLVLRQAGVAFADLAFPAPTSIEVVSTLRNKLKKQRTKLRTEVAAQLKGLTAPKGAVVDATYTAIVSGEVAGESDFRYERKAAPAPASAKAAKQEKAKKEEEDLDAIFAEFGVTTTTETKKKKKSKK
jgi:hypothetical protein